MISGEHQHNFTGGTRTLNPFPGYYYVQYVYIPSNTVPRELMLQFHLANGDNSWNHRAYWGNDMINWGTYQTASRKPMGPLPSLRNQWLMLVVGTDDLGTSSYTTNGMGYVLYDGGVYWDFSTLADSIFVKPGIITVSGLLSGQKIELYDSQGVLKASSTVPTGQTYASLDVYDAGINVFPYTGYIKVYASNGRVHLQATGILQLIRFWDR